MTIELTLRFERVTCTRCFGSGRYSWCEMYGDRCFKCGGSGEQLTKRGEATSVWLRDRLATTADDIDVGDRINLNRVKFTVTSIENNVPTGWGRIVDGETIWIDGLRFTSANGKTYRAAYDAQCSRVATDADRKAAAEYQNRLTKAGKPRKRA